MEDDAYQTCSCSSQRFSFALGVGDTLLKTVQFRVFAPARIVIFQKTERGGKQMRCHLNRENIAIGTECGV